MNRTDRRKLTYIGILALLFGAIAWLIWHLPTFPWLYLGLGLLIIGRVTNHMLRDLFRSRSLLAKDQFEDARAAATNMLATLERQPWRQLFMYWYYGIYTFDANAMTRNNLGAAEMLLGNLEAAEKQLKAASERDPLYPIPDYNLAIIEAVRGNNSNSEALLQSAARKGFTGSNTDRLIERVTASYAKVASVF